MKKKKRKEYKKLLKEYNSVQDDEYDEEDNHYQFRGDEDPADLEFYYEHHYSSGVDLDYGCDYADF